MTFIHTFYSEPLYGNKFADFEESLNNILWDYGCSAMFVKKFGHKIKLFTDERGKELMSCIPYDEIIVLNDINVTPHFAASFKFYALQQCELGDILIDGDTILIDRRVFDIIRLAKQDVMFSFIEKNDYIMNLKPNKTYGTQKEYFEDLFQKMNVPGLKYDLPKISELQYFNTSLLKINNQDLKDEYVEQYFYHMNLLKDVDFSSTWPDLIIEQHFLEKIVEYNDYPYKPIIINFPSSKDWEDKIGFTHLGGQKRQFLPLMKQLILQKNRELYQAIYEKVQEEIKNRH